MNREKLRRGRSCAGDLGFQDFYRRHGSPKHVTSSMHVMQAETLLSCRVVQRKFQNLCTRSWIFVDAR
jgi:hypothetical protein